MPQARGDPRGQGLIRELRMLGGLVHDTAPREHFSHPAAVLLHGGAGVVPGEVLSFPNAERRADFVPIFHGGTEVSQDPSFEISELADFHGQRFCHILTHLAKLALPPYSSKTEATFGAHQELREERDDSFFIASRVARAFKSCFLSTPSI